MTLDELGALYGTDKFDIHGFTSIYDTYFSSIRDNEIRLLEIGVLHGSSLKMWEQYFQNGTIYGADIFSEEERLSLDGAEKFKPLLVFDEKRTKIFNQINQEKIEDLLKLPDDLDIIVDDGGHTMFQQQLTFKTLFNNLKLGGNYILEDLHTSRYSNYGVTNNNTTLQLLKDLQNKRMSNDQY